MRRTHLNRKFRFADFAKIAALVFLLTSGLPTASIAQQKEQKTFSSPEDAANALVAAAQANDPKALLEILGPDGEEIISSGDSTQDAENYARFSKKYEEMHRFVKEPGGYMLYIGAENWPYPIPLVNKGNLWFFDTGAGKMEILYRRIGRNEMSAIRICEELVAAQKEYYSEQSNQYAQQVFSDEGQHNGLYWTAAAGEHQSPIGPQVAAAVAEGYVKGQAGPPTPYRGYLFHVLTRQGKHAPGGAKNFIINGKMTEGFAFVASPAKYRSSGVMTFIVGADGVVYQKDLGKKTEALGKAMKEYGLDSTWQRAVEEPQQTAHQEKPQ